MHVRTEVRGTDYRQNHCLCLQNEDSNSVTIETKNGSLAGIFLRTTKKNSIIGIKSRYKCINLDISTSATFSRLFSFFSINNFFIDDKIEIKNGSFARGTLYPRCSKNGELYKKDDHICEIAGILCSQKTTDRIPDLIFNDKQNEFHDDFDIFWSYSSDIFCLLTKNQNNFSFFDKNIELCFLMPSILLHDCNDFSVDFFNKLVKAENIKNPYIYYYMGKFFYQECLIDDAIIFFKKSFFS